MDDNSLPHWFCPKCKAHKVAIELSDSLKISCLCTTCDECNSRFVVQQRNPNCDKCDYKVACLSYPIGLKQ